MLLLGTSGCDNAFSAAAFVRECATQQAWVWEAREAWK